MTSCSRISLMSGQYCVSETRQQAPARHAGACVATTDGSSVRSEVVAEDVDEDVAEPPPPAVTSTVAPAPQALVAELAMTAFADVQLSVDVPVKPAPPGVTREEPFCVTDMRSRSAARPSLRRAHHWRSPCNRWCVGRGSPAASSGRSPALPRHASRTRAWARPGGAAIRWWRGRRACASCRGCRRRRTPTGCPRRRGRSCRGAGVDAGGWVTPAALISTRPAACRGHVGDVADGKHAEAEVRDADDTIATGGRVVVLAVHTVAIAAGVEAVHTLAARTGIRADHPGSVGRWPIGRRRSSH